MLAASLLALVLSQGSPTMAGPLLSPSGDYFAALVYAELSPSAECACAALTATDGSTVTTSRASSGYCTKSTGVMVLCADNTARVSASGVLVEGERTNLLLRSEELSNGVWSNFGTTITNDTFSSPWGSLVMDTMTSGATFQTPTFSSRTGPYTISSFGRSVSGTHSSGLDLFISTGGISGCTCRTSDGASCSTTVLSGDCIADKAFTTTTSRLEVSSSGNATTSLFAVLDAAAYGAPGGESHVWSGTQFELAAFASSYIPTGATAATRAAEDIHLAPSRNISAIGCVRATVTFPLLVTAGMRVLGGTVDTAPIYVASATELAVSDGANTATIDVGALAGTTMTIRAGWAGSSMTIQTNTDVGNGTFDGDMDMGTVYLGSQEGTSNFLYGQLKDVRFGTVAAGCAL